MRDTFHGELLELRDLLSDMCVQAATAMRDATDALLSADLVRAEAVLSADAELDRRRDEVEERARQMLVLQAPKASDLRLVLSSIYCADRVERMGDLAEHIASTTRRIHPAHVVPPELRDTFAELGTIAASMADGLVPHIACPREGTFAELDETDHRVDDLHAEVLHRITGVGWRHGVQAATSLALVVRFYERFADQAVSVAKRVEFVSTGVTPR
ncbi:phosphate signaling complex PhoU family protein [Actinophytocola oryzae]|uniref:Phosphate transport system protein n=1 Tax=Actinophytocola oryzae TaxID=502181 RepID=A0A4R7VUQ7_9PSEU|nr:PhoU domain-containing protein [Actinophytocola oryzae]TDV53584.1 phosphate transport system protein [Actinophytocola oryzae]